MALAVAKKSGRKPGAMAEAPREVFMKTFFMLLAVVPLLAACSREDKPKEPGLFPGSGPTFAPDPPATAAAPTPPTPSTGTVVFAGQSNILANNGLSASFVVTGQAHGKTVDTIECAVGGSYLDEWQKGQLHYEACMAKMKADLPTALVWWQGEADAHEMTLAQAWAGKFTRMIDDIRRDIGYQIPVIYVQLGDGPTGEMAGPNWQELRRQQASVSLPYSLMVDVTFAHHLRKINPDGNIDVHYVPEGYRVIGEVLARRLAEWGQSQ